MRHLPNTITLVNLAAGILGICAVFLGYIELLPLLVGIALLADYLDGMIARAMNTGSALGAQLDSLADMTTFGILPGIILFYMGTNSFADTGSLTAPGYAYLALLLPIFSAYRLGKFNIDTRQTEHFLGMPTPAAGMLVLGLLLWYSGDNVPISNILHSPTIIGTIAILLSYLMISEIPMLNFKLKKISWNGNEWRWVLAAGIVISAIIFRMQFFAPAMIWYIAISFFKAVYDKYSSKQP